MGKAGFWDNQEAAQQLVVELKQLKTVVSPIEDLDTASADLAELLEMGENDQEIAAEVTTEIDRLEMLVNELELKSMLSGPHDQSGAIMTINARDGGTDANDWAEMMLRMYTQWAHHNDYSIALMDRNDNDVAGINSVTISIRWFYSFTRPSPLTK